MNCLKEILIALLAISLSIICGHVVWIFVAHSNDYSTVIYWALRTSISFKHIIVLLNCKMFVYLSKKVCLLFLSFSFFINECFRFFFFNLVTFEKEYAHRNKEN